MPLDSLEQVVGGRARGQACQLCLQELLKRLAAPSGAPQELGVDIVGDVFDEDVWHGPMMNADLGRSNLALPAQRQPNLRP